MHIQVSVASLEPYYLGQHSDGKLAAMMKSLISTLSNAITISHIWLLSTRGQYEEVNFSFYAI